MRSAEDILALTDDERRALATELAQKYLMVDGHIDVPFRMVRRPEDVSVATESGDFDYPRAKAGGLDAPFMSIYTPAIYQERGGAKAFADSLIEMVNGIAAGAPDKFAIATSPAEVRDQFERGLISLPLGMENGAPIEDDLANVQYFFERGIRYVTLTHGRDNLISDSSYDTTGTHGGLSDFGREVVAEMNRLGIMIDVSHLSDAATNDVFDITAAPVIASHSSARRFTPGFERNMSDALIQRLAENEGVIMINFGSSFISASYRERRAAAQEHVATYAEENNLTLDERTAYAQQYFADHVGYADLSDVVAHFEHVRELVGIDYIGLGSDYDGVGDSLPNGLKDASTYPNLIYELLSLGYSESDIEKIMSGNVMRVWETVERVAAAS
ncbi:MAG: dipeptidase [Bacteroidota bacterium]